MRLQSPRNGSTCGCIHRDPCRSHAHLWRSALAVSNAPAHATTRWLWSRGPFAPCWLLTRIAELGGFTRGGWLAGAAGSSALFGAVHLYQGPSGVLATALTGAVLAAIYMVTGRNLWGCILAHGTLDTTGFVLIYFGVYPGL